jgi:hypothetical protein
VIYAKTRKWYLVHHHTGGSAAFGIILNESPKKIGCCTKMLDLAQKKRMKTKRTSYINNKPQAKRPTYSTLEHYAHLQHT